jgi:hypothetical protein
VRRIVVLAVIAALLSGCAVHGAAPIPLAPAGTSDALGSPGRVGDARRGKAKLVIRIRIPKAHRRAHYISAGTKGATLQFTGPTTLTQAIALTPSDPRCTGMPLVCTIVVSLPPGSYTANISTYNAAPVGGAIPGSAKVLSTAKNVAATINTSQANSLSFTLDGVASALLVTNLPSATAGTAFTEAKAFSVTAQDAAGYTIVGTYDNPIALTDSDTSGATHVLTSGIDSPPANTLLSSADVAKLSYDGTAIPPATITAASTGATNGTDIFSTLFTLSAATGSIGTSVTETITGAGFVGGSTNVNVGGSGVTVSDVTVGSSTSLTATFFIDPAAATGSRDVTVTTPSGTTGTTPFAISNTGVDIVTLATDTTPGTTPGICPAGAAGDLRNAICNASAADTIVFDTQTMCGSTACTITLAAPLPPIVQNQTIDGGSFGRVTIDGNSAYRVFWVDTAAVTLANLHIRNASATGGNGGNGSLAFGAGGGGAGLGAGVFVNQSAAIVTVSNDYFSNDAVTGGNGGNHSGGAGAGSGGGGIGGSGYVGLASTPRLGGGGGGVLASAIGSTGANGGGGGGAAQDSYTGSPGGSGYAGNSAGSAGGNYGTSGGNGGFGGGGGGGGPTYVNATAGGGGAGGFGAGGGGGAVNYNGTGTGGDGGAGGAGGGGGNSGYGPVATGNAGSGGSLATISGGNGGGYGAGGGAAAGPAIFVNAGTLTTSNSGATGSSATGGSGGDDADGSTDGGSNNTPVYNYGGTVNASSTTGPIASALGPNQPSARRIHSRTRRTPPKR